MRLCAGLLVLGLSLGGCAQPDQPSSPAKRGLAEPIEVGQTPRRPFTGRFLEIWGTRNAAEITSARRNDGGTILTEVILARAPGQLTDGDVEVAVLSFQLRISCDPVTYEIVRTVRLAQDGRILGGHDSPNGDDGVEWSPEGPYTGLARQLCSRTAAVQTDFTSLEEFRSEALTRSEMTLRAYSPKVLSPGEAR